MKTCQRCQKNYEIAPEDNEFRAKISPVFNGQTYLIPEPKFCPDCRLHRKLAWRNERNLYKRKCSASGKEIISTISPDSPYIVYEQSEWSKITDSNTEYSQDFDFNRPFFDQFNELLHRVPILSLWNQQEENSEYNSNCFQMKDSYMNVGTVKAERNFYSYSCVSCSDISACIFTHNSELAHECIDCDKIYNSFYCQDVQNSTNCYFSSDLISCKNCFACHGLRRKEYCLYNQQLSKEEYEAKLKDFKFTQASIEKMKEESYKVYLQTPKRSLKMTNCEDCQGNYLINCKNVKSSIDINDSENLKYVTYAPSAAKNSQDAYGIGYGAEWLYEYMGGPAAYNSAFIYYTVGGLANSYYCVLFTNNTKDCFGCVSLSKKQYCILNKQYTKEEYEALVPKIIEYMKQTGEWGEYFPASMSIYAYNETLANEYWPMTKDQALAENLKWMDKPEVDYNSPQFLEAKQIPGDIENTKDSIVNNIYKCELTQKPFKIVKQELDHYRKLGVPVPRLCPEQRYLNNIKLRDSRHFYQRNCAKCQTKIETTYSPENPEIVYCKTCYDLTVS